MKAHEYQRVREVYLGACEREPGERAAYLDEICGADAKLRGEVESLLAHDGELSSFLESPALGHEIAAHALHEASERRSQAHAQPQRIGRYTVRETIGAGGMGVVYLAEQENPRRTVALKVIRPGIATPRMLQRFEKEAQLLGRLQHPGIAQIFEAGTAEIDGEARPFFAMELAQGVPLARYVREKSLGTRARLELFARICDAVEHAHQKGVVHRDLKPDNILVDEAGNPKILDFGVARATDSDVLATTVATEIGQVLGTLPYMSPEQVSGGKAAVDARSDEYALGVLLYELLTGRLPYDFSASTILEAARVINEREPAPLHALDPTLKGDLETIVAKALEKERTRRYSTVSELSADVRRYLTDEPIAARPQSSLYQLRKFAQRNKTLVGGVAGVCVALLIGIVATGRQAVIAGERRDTAERALVRAREIQGFLEDTLASIDPEIARGRDVTILREMLDGAASRVAKELAGQPDVEAALRDTIGNAYTRLALFDLAEPHLVRALEIRKRLLGPLHADVALSLESLGRLMHDRKQASESETLYREALNVRRSLSPVDEGKIAGTLNNLANAHKELGADADAEAFYREALAILRRDPKGGARALAACANNLAGLLVRRDRSAEAAALYGEALQIERARNEPDGPFVADLLDHLGTLEVERSDAPAAERDFREALSIRRSIFHGDHPQLANSLNNLGSLLSKNDELDEADRLLTESLEMRQRVFGEHSIDAAQVLCNLAALRAKQGRAAESVELVHRALAIVEIQPTASHALRAMLLERLAAALHDMGKRDKCEALHRQALAEFREQYGNEHSRVAWVLMNLGNTSFEKDDVTAAEAQFTQALEIRRKVLATGHLDTASSLFWLANVLVERDDAIRAEPLVRESLEIRVARLPADHTLVAESRAILGRALAALGRYEEAAQELTASLDVHRKRFGEDDRRTRYVAKALAELESAAGDAAADDN